MIGPVQRLADNDKISQMNLDRDHRMANASGRLERASEHDDNDDDDDDEVVENDAEAAERGRRICRRAEARRGSSVKNSSRNAPKEAPVTAARRERNTEQVETWAWVELLISLPHDLPIYRVLSRDQ
ncbi:hypothetical protein KPH14_007563 [Odynerus spinipes]|uniref:Uncharacterized protein n=1 Tax=Odynerus spinipes TaxID=1348599 RepID=A0AAD9RHI2_9HYME|nr:hypothetical protein KPH14_007563 [Odynerus spinipes]